MKEIHVNQLDQANIKNLIDVREVFEYTTGHVKHAKNIPLNELIYHPTKYLNQEETYHIICQSGGRSSMVCMMLEAQGYDVINVAGGTGSYMGQLT